MLTNIEHHATVYGTFREAHWRAGDLETAEEAYGDTRQYRACPHGTHLWLIMILDGDSNYLGYWRDPDDTETHRSRIAFVTSADFRSPIEEQRRARKLDARRAG